MNKQQQPEQMPSIIKQKDSFGSTYTKPIKRNSKKIKQEVMNERCPDIKINEKWFYKGILNNSILKDRFDVSDQVKQERIEKSQKILHQHLFGIKTVKEEQYYQSDFGASRQALSIYKPQRPKRYRQRQQYGNLRQSDENNEKNDQFKNEQHNIKDYLISQNQTKSMDKEKFKRKLNECINHKNQEYLNIQDNELKPDLVPFNKYATQSPMFTKDVPKITEPGKISVYNSMIQRKKSFLIKQIKSIVDRNEDLNKNSTPLKSRGESLEQGRNYKFKQSKSAMDKIYNYDIKSKTPDQTIIIKSLKEIENMNNIAIMKQPMPVNNKSVPEWVTQTFAKPKQIKQNSDLILVSDNNLKLSNTDKINQKQNSRMLLKNKKKTQPIPSTTLPIRHQIYSNNHKVKELDIKKLMSKDQMLNQQLDQLSSRFKRISSQSIHKVKQQETDSVRRNKKVKFNITQLSDSIDENTNTADYSDQYECYEQIITDPKIDN